MFELVHFRGSDKIIKEKKMGNGVKQLMEYIHDCLFGTRFKSELLRQALTEMDWKNGELNILDGRRYFYKGFKNRIALDGSFSSYEYIQNALLKLQVGFDKKKIDMGIVMVTAQRSEKSKLGSTKDLVAKEIELLYPTISLPVTIVLFDLGKPGELYDEKKQNKEEVLLEKADVDQNLVDKYLHGDSAIKKDTDKKKKAVAKSKAKIHLVKNEPPKIAVNQ